jgi:enoyl-CoA hydratase/carnithine racemase
MTAHEAMVTGRRYGGADALAAGIVQEVAAEEEVLPAAIAWAADKTAKAGPGIAGIRTHLHQHVIALLIPDGPADS